MAEERKPYFEIDGVKVYFYFRDGVTEKDRAEAEYWFNYARDYLKKQGYNVPIEEIEIAMDGKHNYNNMITVSFKELTLEKLDRPKEFLPEHFKEYPDSNWGGW